VAEPGFTGAGLDRADHLRLNEQELATLRLHAEARLLSLAELDPVLDHSGGLAWSALSEEIEETIFLGLDGGAPRFAPLIRTTALGQRAWGVFQLLAQMSPRDAAIWAAARSLNEWHNRHVYCGVCGTETRSFRAGWGRLCPNCGMEHFPRVDPVVIMLAEHEGRVLVARGIGYPPRRYSALAGFVEPAESIEEAVARELMEEAGIAVADVRYVASQPWPFPGSLMIACLARAETDRLTLDGNELEDAIWVDRADVESALAGDPGARFQAPPPYAIANTLLTRWIELDREGERR
jgi:NAD+ diphosphatase